MNIQRQVELSTFSSFMLTACADYFVSINSVKAFQELMETALWKEQPHYFLGGGSNTLFMGTYHGLVVKNEIEGLSIEEEHTHSMRIRVGAGENWQHLVLWSIDQGLWGFENLVLIPGTVGAAPVQNIGAYGVELVDTLVSVEVIDTHTKNVITLSCLDCELGYRNSIFKKNPGRYFITHVSFELSKEAHPVLTYGRVKEEIELLKKKTIEPKDVARVITSLRDSKLPRIGDIGTAGSFFKNPVITHEHAEKLKQHYPHMPQYEVDQGVKIPAAWLIEYCGYKGKRRGAVGTYDKHALVLVNHGGAEGSELWKFAQDIMSDVQKCFDISLEPEVNLLGETTS